MIAPPAYRTAGYNYTYDHSPALHRARDCAALSSLFSSLILQLVLLPLSFFSLTPPPPRDDSHASPASLAGDILLAFSCIPRSPGGSASRTSELNTSHNTSPPAL